MKGTFVVKTESGSVYTITSTCLGNLQIFTREPKPLPFKVGGLIGSGEVEFSGLEKVGEKITSQDLAIEKNMFVLPLDIARPEDLPEGEVNFSLTFFAQNGEGWWITSPVVSVKEKTT